MSLHQIRAKKRPESGELFVMPDYSMKNKIQTVIIFMISWAAIFFIPLDALCKVELAIINDPDGYTNIREGQGTHTKILAKIVKDEIFYFIPSKISPWWEASKINGIKGYVHKSRIYPLKDMSNKEKNEFISKIFNIELNLAKNKRKSFEFHTEWVNFHETSFVPILDIFSKYICEHKDISVLELFMDILVAEPGSADESPSFALGEIYLCHPGWTLKAVKQRKSDLINGQLEWGFKNVTYKKEDQIQNYDKLKEDLEDL